MYNVTVTLGRPTVAGIRDLLAWALTLAPVCEYQDVDACGRPVNTLTLATTLCMAAWPASGAILDAVDGNMVVTPC